MENAPSLLKSIRSSHLVLSQQEITSPPVSIYFETRCVGQGELGHVKGQRTGREVPVPKSIFLWQRVQDAV